MVTLLDIVNILCFFDLEVLCLQLHHIVIKRCLPLSNFVWQKFLLIIQQGRIQHFQQINHKMKKIYFTHSWGAL